MSSCSPCSYCGANIVRRHSGVKYASTTSPAARASITRGPVPTGSWKNRVLRARNCFMALPRFHRHVALHLLVECRAEVRAVVRIHALLRRERHHFRFARIDDEVDVVVEQAESVEHV